MSDLGLTATLIGAFLLVALVLRGLQRWLDRDRDGSADERDKPPVSRRRG
jgi:hypothetical protein